VHKLYIYTIILRQNTENSYTFQSVWDHHQRVCTSNDLVLNTSVEQEEF